ncbi:MAG: A24 family peptidase [Planctomycetaceae bacterium]|nr:A24 family peptidase [Planctomycetaceae bacterium]
MNPFLSLPLTLQLVVVFILGTLGGAAVNWAAYYLAWNRRPISPWSAPDPSAPKRHAWDRLPVIGWLGLRREVALHGPGFWVRPMLVEIVMGVGLAWLYWWEVDAAGLLPNIARANLAPLVGDILQTQFVAHAILIALMLAGSLIDADEKIIPDEITVSGTLIGLLLAAAWPASLLPVVQPMGNGPPASLGYLRLTSPLEWPAWLDGRPWRESLAIALGCWWLWCVAILPRTWYTRHGCLRAVRLCCARVIRERATYRILRLALFGALAVLLVWYRGGVNWESLLTALVGMAVGGGLIWSVRIIGAVALGREAMGFGDVMLMAMIGAFLGWQPCLMIFFLAPVAGLFIGLVRLLLVRDREIPYGPFLCLATLCVIVWWSAIWEWGQDIFALGWLVPAAMLCCLILMAGMLAIWRLIVTVLR